MRLITLGKTLLFVLEGREVNLTFLDDDNTSNNPYTNLSKDSMKDSTNEISARQN